MKMIETHKVNGCNDGITIEIRDEPGVGGACNHYWAYWDEWDGKNCCYIDFQNGPIPEVGVNGLTHEVLLAIIQHRLEGFQSGEFACEENEQALEAIKQALEHLKRRTEKRLARGVEGTHAV